MVVSASPSLVTENSLGSIYIGPLPWGRTFLVVKFGVQGLHNFLGVGATTRFLRLRGLEA